ncbi:SGNH/GDSL hydrolase family protein [Bradyrhizobium sp. BRP14]|nr:SGNH/GDSL hydrolase family protein [Bradyrhizobium sp. BRP14]
MKMRHLGLLLCGLLGLYLLISPIYALLHFKQFASLIPHLMRYVVVPGLLGFAFVAVGLLAKPRFSVMVGTCGLSVLAGLFLFEALLTVKSVSVRLGMLGQLNEAQAETLGRMTNAVRGFTLRGLNRRSGTEELSKALLSGFPSSQVVLCTSESDIVSYTADRYGFNNPDQVYGGKLDLVLLGDSFVEGFCLPPGEDLASQLRNGGLAAVSLGIRGNGPLLELAMLGRFGEELQPRHVMMAFFEGNDWENLEKELTVPWLRAALSSEANYGSQSTAQETMRAARMIMGELNKRPVTMADLVSKTAMIRNFVALQQTFTQLGLIYPKIAHTIPEFRDTLHRAKTLTESWGGTFTLVYVPRADRFMGSLSSDRIIDQLKTMVLDVAKVEGIAVVDLHKAFRSHPEPSRMYAPDHHFSREGASLAADVILRHLGAIEQSPKNIAVIK